MAGKFHSFSYDELSRGLTEALAWLESLGVRIESTRLQRYQKLMDELLTLYHANDYEEGDRRLPEFVNLLLEAHELLEIHRGLSRIEIPPSVLPQLKKLSTGPESYANENPSSSNAGRNAGFELLVASLVAQTGLPVVSIGTSDVATTFNGKTLVIECKRPHGEASVKRNWEKAESQLKKRFSGLDSVHTRGIVALDLTRVLSPDFQTQPYGNLEELYSWIDETSNSLVKRYVPEGFEPKHRKTIAILLRFTAMALPTQENDRISYCQQYVISSFGSSRFLDKRLAENFADLIETTRPT